MRRFTLLLAILLLVTRTLFAADQGWPRTKTVGTSTVTLFQPQVESWPGYATLNFRLAVAVGTADGGEPAYGVVVGTAATKVNWQDRTVLVAKPSFGQISFPGASAENAAAYTSTLQQAIPAGTSCEIALDRILANVRQTDEAQKSVAVNLAPPPIFFSATPAVLVVYTGAPQWTPVTRTTLLYASNTNWNVFRSPGQNGAAASYYLLAGDGWVTGPDPLAGPWTPAQSLPPDLYNLPDDEGWNQVRPHVPGAQLDSAPTVFTSTQPAELILTKGDPTLMNVAGTQLLYVGNTTSDVFLAGDGRYYFLAAGRWFSAAGLSGPWSAATKSLPADFAKIPLDSPKADVLASVAGTPQAQEAILQASIPHKATVNIASTTVSPGWQGAPKFAPIAGADGVSAAENTSYAVFQVGDLFYCCHAGIWFQAASAAGPWTVCANVPAAIYSIPVASPYHNVTYVYAYSSTPTDVVCGYTAGYDGEYVSDGVLMFGGGYWLGADAVWGPYSSWVYPPCWYSYGCAARYDCYDGGYVRGAACYGPYGGAGYGARYNPATGTYAQGAAAYGPYGAAGAASAYNPWTGRGAATSQARTPYGSWGHSVVADGDGWAETGHTSNAWGTTGAARTSTGAAGAVHAGPMGTTSIAHTAGGDVYAGHDGNVYKYNPGNGGWDRHDGSGWQSTNLRAATPAQQAMHPSAWGGDGGGDVNRQLNGDAWGRQWGGLQESQRSGWGGGGFGGGGFRGRR